MDGYAYLAIGTIDVVSAAGVVSVALALAIKFQPDAIEINGIHIGSFNTALVDMIGFFSKHKEANPDETIVNPNPGSGGTTKPGEGTGDATQPGTATGGSTQPGEDPEGDSDSKIPQKAKDALEKIDKDPQAYLEDYNGNYPFRDQPNITKGETKIPNPNVATYKEWDINPYKYGQNRGTERIVTGSDGSAWYTPDHYKTWYQMR